MTNIQDELTQLEQKLAHIAAGLKVPHLTRQIETLEAKTTAPDFWSHEPTAKAVLQQLSDLKAIVDQVQELQTSLSELTQLAALAGPDDQAEVEQQLLPEVKSLAAQIDKLERHAFLSGPHDASHAILSVHAGQGGVEAQDWTEMLLRMYQRFVEANHWSHDLIAESRGEEAGLKSAVVLIKGRYAYGLLKGEQGTHRLVRQSPFNADNLRQTSFALVEVLPEIKETKEVAINPDDLQWQFFRSSGKGGQNVNKVSTAVRLTHRPTGISVESQTERTQVQNRELALSLLRAKLWEQQSRQTQALQQDLKGEHHPATWGTQIRSYVLHPYQLVKDHRTQVETSAAQAVLDGDLEPFIEAQLRLDPPAS